MTLALSYRPKTWSDIVGQQTVRVVLQQMVKRQQVPPALLFAGPRGTGKTTTARVLAAALNCDSRGPCGECLPCTSILRGDASDVLEIDAASNGLVADIRKIRDAVQYAVTSEYRVVLLDEAHSMSREAFNALLKTLEEPPERTVFVLLTTEPGRVLETVQSRCMTFEFKRVTTADIENRLSYIAQREQILVDEDVVRAIAERSNGGLRDAIMTLDQISLVGVRTLADFALLLGEIDMAPDLFAACLDKDLARAYSLVDDLMTRSGDAAAISSALVALCRDLLVIKAGGDVPRSGASLDARDALAGRVSPERILGGLRVLWDLKTKIRPSDDARATLDLAVAMFSEAVGGIRRTAADMAPQQDDQKLSFDKLTLG